MSQCTSTSTTTSHSCLRRTSDTLARVKLQAETDVEFLDKYSAFLGAHGFEPNYEIIDSRNAISPVDQKAAKIYLSSANSSMTSKLSQVQSGFLNFVAKYADLGYAMSRSLLGHKVEETTPAKVDGREEEELEEGVIYVTKKSVRKRKDGTPPRSLRSLDSSKTLVGESCKSDGETK